MGNFGEGNRGGFRGRSTGGRFGNRDGFSRDKNAGRRPLQLYGAVCGKCGTACQVPFKPTGNRPIFCKNCFSQNGSASVSSHVNNVQAPSQNYSGQFNQINAKLDKIIKILAELELIKEDGEELEDDEEIDEEDEDNDDLKEGDELDESIKEEFQENSEKDDSDEEF